MSKTIKLKTNNIYNPARMISSLLLEKYLLNFSAVVCDSNFSVASSGSTTSRNRSCSARIWSRRFSVSFPKICIHIPLFLIYFLRLYTQSIAERKSFARSVFHKVCAFFAQKNSLAAINDKTIKNPHTLRLQGKCTI